MDVTQTAPVRRFWNLLHWRWSSEVELVVQIFPAILPSQRTFSFCDPYLKFCKGSIPVTSLGWIHAHHFQCIDVSTHKLVRKVLPRNIAHISSMLHWRESTMHLPLGSPPHLHPTWGSPNNLGTLDSYQYRKNYSRINSLSNLLFWAWLLLLVHTILMGITLNQQLSYKVEACYYSIL